MLIDADLKKIYDNEVKYATKFKSQTIFKSGAALYLEDL